MPAESLVDAANTQRSEIVCVSAIVAGNDVERYAREVRAGLNPGCLLVMGGAAVREQELPSIDGVHWARSTEELWTHLSGPSD